MTEAPKTFALPPAGFDALTASDSTLRFYGLHPRPDATKYPLVAQKWEEIYSKKLTFLQPELQPMEASPADAGAQKVEAAAASGGAQKEEAPVASGGAQPENLSGVTIQDPLIAPIADWSGSAVVTSLADAIYFVIGSFTVTTVKSRWPGALDEFAETWVGVGGFSGPLYCRIGVHQEVVFTIDAVDQATYTPFVQWPGQGQMSIKNFSVNPGDELSILVCTRNTPTTQGYFYIANVTQGLHMTIPFQLAAPTLPSLFSTIYNTSAEWIVSRPVTSDTVGPEPANFGTVTFNDAIAYTYGGNELYIKDGQWLNYKYEGKPATKVGPSSAAPTSESSLSVTSL